jgi:hypothetical protein
MARGRPPRADKLPGKIRYRKPSGKAEERPLNRIGRGRQPPPRLDKPAKP